MATFLERVADKFIGDRMEMEVGRLYFFLFSPSIFSPSIAFILLITPRYFFLINISSGFLRLFNERKRSLFLHPFSLHFRVRLVFDARFIPREMCSSSNWLSMEKGRCQAVFLIEPSFRVHRSFRVVRSSFRSADRSSVLIKIINFQFFFLY